MKNTTLWGIVSIFLLAAVTFGVAVWGTPASKPEVIKIGVIASLTGGNATRGESTLQGLELAKHEIEESGILKRQTIELLVQDLPSEKSKDTPGAYNQLTDIEHVVAIVGPMGSGPAVAVAPLVDAKKVPVIVHAASAQDATNGNEYVFRLWPISKQYADIMLVEIEKRGYQRIAILSTQQDNTIELRDILRERLGSRVVIQEDVAVDTKDFRTQLTKMKASNPDAIFLNTFAGQIGIAAKQAQTLGITAPFFTNGVMSVSELPAANGALEGTWFPRFAGYTDEAKEKFVGYFGKEPSVPENAAAGHDALIAIADAISYVGTDSVKIKEYLYSHSFDGAIGRFSFDVDGNAILPIAIWMVSNNALTGLK